MEINHNYPYKGMYIGSAGQRLYRASMSPIDHSVDSTYSGTTVWPALTLQLPVNQAN